MDKMDKRIQSNTTCYDDIKNCFLLCSDLLIHNAHRIANCRKKCSESSVFAIKYIETDPENGKKSRVSVINLFTGQLNSRNVPNHARD